MIVHRLDIELPGEGVQTLLNAISEHGCVVGTITVRHQKRPVADFARLFVAPHCRRQNIGRLLLETAEAIARESGCDGLSCNVTAANPEGAQFYKALGFIRAFEYSDGDQLFHKPFAAVRVIGGAA